MRNLLLILFGLYFFLSNQFAKAQNKDSLKWEAFWSHRLAEPENFHDFENINLTYLEIFEQKNNYCKQNPNFKSDWKFIGPNEHPHLKNNSAATGMGIIVSLALDPKDKSGNTLYAGSNTSGLWKTTNALDSITKWHCVSDVANLPGLGVFDIAINPKNNQEIYIATGVSILGKAYGIGVLKTTNGGNSWQKTGLTFSPEFKQITQAIEIDPKTNFVYALSENSVYESRNEGLSFKKIFELKPSKNAGKGKKRTLRDLIIDTNSSFKKDEIRLYVSSNDRNADDGGPVFIVLEYAKKRWKNQVFALVDSLGRGAERIDLALSPFYPNKIFVDYAGIAILELDKTQNYKVKIINKSRIGHFHKNDFALSPNLPNRMYQGDLILYASQDSGKNFKPTTNRFFRGDKKNWVHADIRDILISKSKSGMDRIYLANDGGVSISNDNGKTWEIASDKGLAITQYYGIDVAQDYSFILGGCQDLGISRYFKNIDFWDHKIYQDGANCVVDLYNPDKVYAQTWPNGYRVVLSENQLNNSWNITPRYRQKPNAIRPMKMHKNGYLYVGYHDLWRRNDQNGRARNWQKLSNIPYYKNHKSGKEIFNKLIAFDVAESNDDIIYMAYSQPTYQLDTVNKNIAGQKAQNRLYRCRNANDSLPIWEDITGNLGQIINWYGISEILIHPENPKKIWLCFEGITTKENKNIWRVLTSNDGGNSWKDYSQGLSQMPINAIVYQKGTPDALFVATDLGVFYRDKNLKEWICFNENLPTCMVTDLKINYYAQKLVAATFGRGLWECDLPQNYATQFPERIQQDTIITKSYYAYENIIIENGVKLTLKSNLYLPYGKEIIQKGKLILNGGKVINSEFKIEK